MVEKTENEPTGRTWPDVCHYGIRALIRLLDGGHGWRLILILILIIILITVLRMSPNDLGPTWQAVLVLLSSRLWPYVIFIPLEAATIYFWKRDNETNRKEIKRLGDEKSFLVHNPDKRISTHHGSNYDYDLPKERGTPRRKNP